MKPYVYYLRWTNQGLRYYGVRYAKNCHPTDLWTIYFSSSTYVQEARARYGEPDVIQVRKIFESREKAILWESRFLQRIDAKNNPQWLNQYNGDGKFSGVQYHSEKTKQKMSKSATGIKRTCSMERREKLSKFKKQQLSSMTKNERAEYVKRSCSSPESWTAERKEKIRQGRIGKTHNDETRKQMSESKKKMMEELSATEKRKKYGQQNKGKTWKLVDGKRVWFEKD